MMHPPYPCPFFQHPPFGKKKWILFTQERTYVRHFLFVCFIYYIIIIILDCILISLIDFFYHIPYVICRLMIRCVLLLRKYTYSLTIEVPNFQGRTKWRNCRLSTETPEYQTGLAVLRASSLLDTIKCNFIFTCYITLRVHTETNRETFGLGFL